MKPNVNISIETDGKQWTRIPHIHHTHEIHGMQPIVLVAGICSFAGLFYLVKQKHQICSVEPWAEYLLQRQKKKKKNIQTTHEVLAVFVWWRVVLACMQNRVCTRYESMQILWTPNQTIHRIYIIHTNEQPNVYRRQTILRRMDFFFFFNASGLCRCDFANRSEYTWFQSIIKHTQLSYFITETESIEKYREFINIIIVCWCGVRAYTHFIVAFHHICELTIFVKLMSLRHFPGACNCCEPKHLWTHRQGVY